MNGGAGLGSPRLSEAANSDQAARFLIGLGLRELPWQSAWTATPELRSDFIRAFGEIVKNPVTLIRNSQAGVTDYAILLPPLVERLKFSHSELVQVRDLALAAASHKSLEHTAIHGISLPVANIPGVRLVANLALVAVRANTFIERIASASGDAEDLGNFLGGQND